MTFGIMRYGSWRTPYWKPEVSKREHFTSNGETYSDLDEDLFKDVLRDELDVPDYPLTAKNIKKEFGYDDNGHEISVACVKHIIAYYKFRAALYDKICAQLLDGKANAMLKKLGADELTLRYYIKPEFNNFSCEDPDYTGGQLEAYIEIAVYR